MDRAGLTSCQRVHEPPAAPLQQDAVRRLQHHCQQSRGSDQNQNRKSELRLGQVLTNVFWDDPGPLEEQNLQTSLRDPLQNPALKHKRVRTGRIS